MSLPDKNSILKTLADNHRQLESYGVKQIGLLGSYVRNEATKNSDIDLLVDMRKDRKTFLNFMSLNYFLEELLHNTVELITVQTLSPYIGPHILKTVEYAPFK